MQFENDFTRESFTFILALPVILLGIFGITSVAIIAYRVYSFNDCREAAKELTEQIKEAKKDLTSKGFKFETKSS